MLSHYRPTLNPTRYGRQRGMSRNSGPLCTPDLVRVSFEPQAFLRNRQTGGVICDQGSVPQNWVSGDAATSRPYRNSNSVEVGAEGDVIGYFINSGSTQYFERPYDASCAITNEGQSGGPGAAIGFWFYYPSGPSGANTYYMLSVQDSTPTAAGTAWAFACGFSGVASLMFVTSDGSTRTANGSVSTDFGAAGWYYVLMDWWNGQLYLSVNGVVKIIIKWASTFNIPSGGVIRANAPIYGGASTIAGSAIDLITISRYSPWKGQDFPVYQWGGNPMPLRPQAIGTSPGGVLDAWQTNIWGEYSVKRLLLSTYSGSAYRVRRSSDNTEQDIGFVGPFVDTDALLSFVGSSSGYVKTLYDQSGNSRDITQSTQAKQPRIVNAGAYDGKMVFDGSSHSFTSPAFPGGNSGITLFARMRLRSTGARQILFELGENYATDATNNGFDYEYDPGGGITGTRVITSQSGGTFLGDVTLSGFTPTGLIALAMDRTQTTSTTQITLYKNGVSQSEAVGPNVTSPIASGNFGAHTMHFGGRPGLNSNYAQLDLETLVIYTSAQSSGNVASIGALI